MSSTPEQSPQALRDDGHLGLDALADLLAAEGSDADVDHVAGCARCSAALSDLDEALVPLATDLAAHAALPVPPLPDGFDATLRARLADVAVHQTPVPAGRAAPLTTAPGSDHLTGAEPAAPPSHDVVPVRPPAHSTGRSRTGRGGSGPSRAVLGVAAAAAGLLVVAGLGLGLADGGTEQSGDADSSAAGGSSSTGAPPLGDLPVSTTGTDYGRDGRALASALPALLAATGSAERSSGAGPSSGTAAQPSDAARPPGGSTPQGVASVGPLARLREPAALADCLAALTGPDVGAVPLAVDFAAFEGRPALVVVLPSAREDRVDVYVVGAGCRQGDDQTLFFTRLDRP